MIPCAYTVGPAGGSAGAGARPRCSHSSSDIESSFRPTEPKPTTRKANPIAPTATLSSENAPRIVQTTIAAGTQAGTSRRRHSDQATIKLPIPIPTRKVMMKSGVVTLDSSTLSASCGHLRRVKVGLGGLVLVGAEAEEGDRGDHAEQDEAGTDLPKRHAGPAEHVPQTDQAGDEDPGGDQK